MSHWWVRVGMPVDGPARCTFMITAGISAKYDRPMNSCISEMPGPEVAVKARAPFHAAPMTMPIEASSSSPWTMAYFALPVSGSCRSFLQWLAKASASDDDGVIGYHAQTVAPPYTAPSAAALLPSMKIRSPTLSDFLSRKPIGHLRFCNAQSRPRCSAWTFDDNSFSLPLYCSLNSCSISFGSMSSSAHSAPT